MCRLANTLKHRAVEIRGGRLQPASTHTPLSPESLEAERDGTRLTFMNLRFRTQSSTGYVYVIMPELMTSHQNYLMLDRNFDIFDLNSETQITLF